MKNLYGAILMCLSLQVLNSQSHELTMSTNINEYSTADENMDGPIAKHDDDTMAANIPTDVDDDGHTAAVTMLPRPVIEGANFHENWLGNSEQDDTWNFCLATTRIAPNHEQNQIETNTPESQTWLQGSATVRGHKTPIFHTAKVIRVDFATSALSLLYPP
jgi:hypothetical protein